MNHNTTYRWWGAPRKFSANFAERKISWLELFYDLVYVVAISKITQYFSQHLGWSGFLDYVYLFAMIYWGWSNGSLYYDLHGTTGIRNRLMTLWQMVAVAALVICLNSNGDTLLFHTTIALMVMQLYITYLWWSVGIYDKEHRRLNKPYTFFYLLSLALMGSTLFIHYPHYTRIAFYASLFLNFLPPFYTSLLLDRPFTLSLSMAERLGLFTIIMFGEVVTGVINGATLAQEFTWGSWGNFVLAILIVFALWWIFFALIADRTCKPGFLKSQLMMMTYIPVLMSLGMLGAAYARIFRETATDWHWVCILFAFRIATFLLGVVLISLFLEYPPSYNIARKRVQLLLACAAVIIFTATYLLNVISITGVFAIILSVLLLIIVLITSAWLKLEGGISTATTTE